MKTSAAVYWSVGPTSDLLHVVCCSIFYLLIKCDIFYSRWTEINSHCTLILLFTVCDFVCLLFFFFLFFFFFFFFFVFFFYYYYLFEVVFVKCVCIWRTSVFFQFYGVLSGVIYNYSPLPPPAPPPPPPPPPDLPPPPSPSDIQAWKDLGRKKTLWVEKRTKHCHIDDFGYSMFGLGYGWRHVIMYAG